MKAIVEQEILFKALQALDHKVLLRCYECQIGSVDFVTKKKVLPICLCLYSQR